MKLELSFYGCLCATNTFRINGVEADSDDFVDQYDHNRSNAPDYGCGHMSCDIKEPTPEVLDKYNINEQGFYEVAENLSDGLSFGRCGLCS